MKTNPFPEFLCLTGYMGLLVYLALFTGDYGGLVIFGAVPIVYYGED